MRTMLSSASFCFVLPTQIVARPKCVQQYSQFHGPHVYVNTLSSCGSSKRTKLRAGLLNGHTDVFQSSSHVVSFLLWGVFRPCRAHDTVCTYVVNDQLRGRYTRHEVKFYECVYFRCRVHFCVLLVHFVTDSYSPIVLPYSREEQQNHDASHPII